jgi:hypothetical protein
MAAPILSIDNTTLNYRYTTIAQLWMHHNTTHLQWPIVIVGVVLLGLATLSSSMVPLLAVPANWGAVPQIRILGICFLMSGIGVALMCRVMSRARLIMSRAEEELRIIEELLGVPKPLAGFGALNHPPGTSGPRLLRYYLTFGIGLPINVLGLLFCLGSLTGGVTSLLPIVWALWDARGIRSSHSIPLRADRAE